MSRRLGRRSGETVELTVGREQFQPEPVVILPVLVNMAEPEYAVLCIDEIKLEAAALKGNPLHPVDCWATLFTPRLGNQSASRCRSTVKHANRSTGSATGRASTQYSLL